MAIPDGPPLLKLGLRPGDRVRFRRADGGRWHEGRVVRRERDGSVALRDPKGARRAIRPDRLEVRREGPPRRPGVVAVLDLAAEVEQLGLFSNG